MDLNAMLDDAAPRLAERTPELDEALGELMEASRPAPARRRHRRAAVVGGAVGLVAVVGLGGAAAAGIGRDLVAGVFPWTSEEGSACELYTTLEPRSPGEPHYSASQQEAMASAEAWLATFDLDSVDREAAGERWLRHLERISHDDVTRAELQEKFHGERLETHALADEVGRQLDRHLRDQGFDPRSLDGGVAIGCER